MYDVRLRKSHTKERQCSPARCNKNLKSKKKKIKRVKCPRNTKKCNPAQLQCMFLFVLWDCNYCNGIIDELLAEQISQLCIINTIQWCRIDSCHMIGTQQWGNRVLTLFIRELHIFFQEMISFKSMFRFAL